MLDSPIVTTRFLHSSLFYIYSVKEYVSESVSEEIISCSLQGFIVRHAQMGNGILI